MKKFYVYTHSNEKYGVFYVGKGSGKRLYTTGNRSEFWKRIVKKYGYTASIVDECETEQEAYEKEIKLIEKLKKKGECAANFTNGGDGVRVDKRWWGEAISKSLTGKKSLSGPMSKSFKDFASIDDLRNLYETKGLSVVEIAKQFNVSSTLVWQRLKFYGIEIRSIKNRGKKIVCVNTGEKFDSITQAAKQLGLARENIRKVLYKKYKHTGNLTFTFEENT
jgi:biotin operon repressor